MRTPVFIAFFIITLTLSAQQSPPPSTNAPAAAPTIRPIKIDPASDPIGFVRARLKEIECDSPVTCKMIAPLAYCTVACRSIDERNKVYDAFRNIQKYALTSTSNPPTVCVVVVYDAVKYRADRYQRTLEESLNTSKTSISGKVKQVTADGLLVTAGEYVVLVTDGPRRIDNDPISVVGYWIGEYQYTSPDNTVKTVRKYTCDIGVATKHWSPFAASDAESETSQRVTRDRPPPL